MTEWQSLGGGAPARRVRRNGSDLARAGALIEIGLAVILALLLLVATGIGPTDALPRPLVLGVLYLVPGLIGLVGVAANRPSAVIGAALPLIPAMVLSWAGLTMIFVIPAIVMLAGAARMPSAKNAVGYAIGAARAVAIAVLIVVAGWAVLLGLTASACAAIEDGTECSSAAITANGILVALVCLAAAVVIAALPLRRRSTAT